VIPGVIGRGTPQLKALLNLAGADSPQTIGDSVAPVTDLLRWWALGVEIELSSGPQNAGVGVVGEFTTASLQPPQGSAWLIRWASITATGIPAAIRFVIQVACVSVTSSRVFGIGQPNQVTALAALVLVDGTDAETGLIYLPSGYRISPWISENGLAAGSVSVTLNLRVAQFPSGAG